MNWGKVIKSLKEQGEIAEEHNNPYSVLAAVLFYGVAEALEEGLKNDSP